MSEMRVPVSALHLRPGHEQTRISLLNEITRLKGFFEAGPSGARVVLVTGTEKRLTGNNININAVFFIVPVLITECGFCAALLGDLVFQVSQLLLQLLFWRFDIGPGRRPVF